MSPTNGEIWLSRTPAEKAVVAELGLLEEERDLLAAELEKAQAEAAAVLAKRARIATQLDEADRRVVETRDALNQLKKRSGVERGVPA